MAKLSTNDVNAVRPFFRVLAGFIFVLSLISISLTFFVLVVEEWNWQVVVILLIPGVMGWISFKILKTGYPPNFLLFTSTKKREEI